MKIISITAIVAATLILSGCELTLPKMKEKVEGIVSMNQDGNYQLVNFAGDRADVMKIAYNDAKSVCKNEGYKNALTIDQSIKHHETPEVKSGNSFLDAALTVASYKEEKRNDKDFEATTIFNCK